MNNPVQFVQMMRNPQAFLQQAMNDSQLMKSEIPRNAIEMYMSGNRKGLNELADNVCKEKRVNRQDFEKQIRSQIGM